MNKNLAQPLEIRWATMGARLSEQVLNTKMYIGITASMDASMMMAAYILKMNERKRRMNESIFIRGDGSRCA